MTTIGTVAGTPPGRPRRAHRRRRRCRGPRLPGAAARFARRRPCSCWSSSSATCSSTAWACSPSGLARSSPAACSTAAEAGIYQGSGLLLDRRLRGGVRVPDRHRRGVYLEEYATKARFSRFIDVNIRNLAGVPSIVYGILGLAIFVESLERVHRRTRRSWRRAHAGRPGPADRDHHRRRGPPGRARAHPRGGLGVGATRWEVIRARCCPTPPRHPHRHRPVPGPGHRGGGAALPGRGHHRLAAAGRALLDPSQLRERFTALPMVIAEWTKQPAARSSRRSRRRPSW